MIVLDSSAVVDCLLGVAHLGEWVSEQLLREPDLHAPHLIDVEVLEAIRRHSDLGSLEEGRATAAIGDLRRLPLVRHAHGPLLEAAWRLRHHMTASDAVFVSLAAALRAPLVTTDRRLARARLPIEVLAP